MTTRIRIGIIGAGNIGNVHMEIFSGLVERAELKAVTDLEIKKAEIAAEKYGIPTVHTSNQDLIQDPEIDAVIIGVPNSDHASLAVAALEAGKHVLLEKPMAINEEEAKLIVDAEARSGKIVMIPHQMRWESIPMQVKEQIDQGELGNIYHVKAGWFRRKGIPGWGTWFTKKDSSGGGPLIDIGVHLLDLSMHLMGNPKPVSVFGSTYAEFGPDKKGIGTWGTPDWEGRFDVEDLASAFIKMEDGSSLTLDVSWAVNMDTDNEPFVHILGSDGGASIRGNKGKFLSEKFGHEVDIELETPEDDEGERTRLSRYFLDCIEKKQTPISSCQTGYTNNRILAAIYESSRTGSEVKL